MNVKRLGLVVARISLLTVVLMLVNGVGSRFLPSDQVAAWETGAQQSDPQAGQPPASFMTLVLFVMLLQTIALAYPVLRARWRGWRLATAVAVLYFGTVTFMGQIESMIYLGDKMAEGMLPGLFAMGLFNAVVFAPILVLVLGRWTTGAAPAEEPGPPLSRAPTPANLIGRTLVGGAVFLALYYLFGYYVAWQNPAVRAYYGGTDPGSFLAQMGGIVRATPWMLPLQFARGLLWVGLALIVVRMMRGRWWETGLAVSLLFTVPVAYLLLPNPLMPEVVRMTHLMETAPYQFLFGWFVPWLFLDWRPAAAGSREAS